MELLAFPIPVKSEAGSYLRSPNFETVIVLDSKKILIQAGVFNAFPLKMVDSIEIEFRPLICNLKAHGAEII